MWGEDMDAEITHATPEEAATTPEVKYEYLDHPADVQIHAWGSRLREAYEQAAMGMFGYMTDLETVDIEEVREVEAEAEDLEGLLFHFLDECLFVFSCEPYFVARKVEITEWVVDDEEVEEGKEEEKKEGEVEKGKEGEERKEEKGEEGKESKEKEGNKGKVDKSEEKEEKQEKSADKGKKEERKEEKGEEGKESKEKEGNEEKVDKSEEKEEKQEKSADKGKEGEERKAEKEEGKDEEEGKDIEKTKKGSGEKEEPMEEERDERGRGGGGGGGTGGEGTSGAEGHGGGNDSGSRVYRIRAKLFGEEFQLGKHPQGTEVKAITYASMQVYNKPGQHEVFVIIDI